jgi:uncharacterized protein (TIGR03067 family)
MADDLAKLQGTWTITSLETDGRTMPAMVFSGAQIVIEGDRFTSLGMGQRYEGIVELPRAKKTKALDLVFTDGPQAGTRNLGIYKLTGDRWTICLATRGATRPQKFATKPASGLSLETLQRGAAARPKNNRTAVPVVEPTIVPSGPPTVLEGEWAMVEGIFSGKAMAADMIAWVKRVTRGNVTVVLAGPQTMLKATFTIDETNRPPAIDYINLEGSHARKAQAGIFTLDGDTLKICMAAPGKPRPSDLASKSGDGRSFTTWRRVTSAERSSPSSRK